MPKSKITISPWRHFSPSYCIPPQNVFGICCCSYNAKTSMCPFTMTLRLQTMLTLKGNKVFELDNSRMWSLQMSSKVNRKQKYSNDYHSVWSWRKQVASSFKMNTLDGIFMLSTNSNYFGFLVSKETVVLRRWGRSKQKFGFIKQVDKCWITTVKDLESWHFER